MFEDLKAAVAKMNKEAPRPNMPPLELSEAYHLARDWPDHSWPGATRPGVYVFADAGGSVVYVGKASCGQDIGHRLSAYWKHSATREPEAKDTKAEDVCYVLTIAVDRDKAFEAPSIEEWLIRELNPPRNRQGR